MWVNHCLLNRKATQIGINKIETIVSLKEDNKERVEREEKEKGDDRKCLE